MSELHTEQDWETAGKPDHWTLVMFLAEVDSLGNGCSLVVKTASGEKINMPKKGEPPIRIYCDNGDKVYAKGFADGQKYQRDIDLAFRRDDEDG